MRLLKHIFESNAQWAKETAKKDPNFFSQLVAQQSPKYLWIGCSDSRVASNTITGQPPGKIFVHRNVANLVLHTDCNLLSVLQYAVEVLKIPHIIVCGHYGCGGVKAAMSNESHGLIDNWLRHIKDIYLQHKPELDAIEDEQARLDRLCELNVESQVANVVHTSVVQEAWQGGQELCVHGWIYHLGDGLLRDLGFCYDRINQMPEIYRMT